jgi:hypothetical protein
VGAGILRNSGGILSKYRNSCPQEFLRKIPVKSEKKTEFLRPLQNHDPVNNSSGKRRKKKKSSRIMSGTVFGPTK